MLAKCANPQCTAGFHSLRHGRLYVLDARPRGLGESRTGRSDRQGDSLEYFWLCERCCKSMRVAVDRGQRVLVISLEDPEAAPLEVLRPVHPLAERASTRGRGRRLRRPSDPREASGVSKVW